MHWEVQQAARNAFRLHAASLPALASALLLLRMALAMNTSMTHYNIRPKRTHFSHSAKNCTAQTSANSSCIWCSCQAQPDLSRSILYCVVLTWAATASWLWPQLAMRVGWLSHRRPSLPSVTWSAFLLLLTEGLLEACEGAASLMGRCCHMFACACGGTQSKFGQIPVPVQQHSSWRRWAYTAYNKLVTELFRQRNAENTVVLLCIAKS